MQGLVAVDPEITAGVCLCGHVDPAPIVAMDEALGVSMLPRLASRYGVVVFKSQKVPWRMQSHPC